MIPFAWRPNATAWQRLPRDDDGVITNCHHAPSGKPCDRAVEAGTVNPITLSLGLNGSIST
jgi:hypothetical protein